VAYSRITGFSLGMSCILNQKRPEKRLRNGISEFGPVETSPLTRRQFLTLTPLVPPALLSQLQADNPVIVTGFVSTLTGPDGFPTAYQWIESDSLADVTELGQPGYVAIYPEGVSREWLDQFRASLQDLFPEAERYYLPLIFKSTTTGRTGGL